MIIITDYGLGNLGSIENMLKKLNIKCKISADPNDIIKADKLILPGVGSFDDGMKNLQEGNLKAILDQKVLAEKTPILGICLGMQLMTKSSQEGVLPGLGWIDADTIKFTSADRAIKIPHMGWNIARPSRHNCLFNPEEEERFYFVHSYYVKLKNQEELSAFTEYGVQFTSAFQKDNVFGVQFHPEKSHKFGMNLLKKFNSI